MYQVSLKIFCFESGDRFEGADKKEVGKGLCERGFGMICFMEMILTLMWCRRELSILWGLVCSWGEEGLRSKMISNNKRIGFLKVWWHRVKKCCIFSIGFLFCCCFRPVWCSPGIVRFGKNVDVVFIWIQKSAIFSLGTFISRIGERTSGRRIYKREELYQR